MFENPARRVIRRGYDLLSEAIEKTHALASTWMCVSRPASQEHPKRNHRDVIEALSGGDAARAADAMRKHIISSMTRAVERLQPYFHLGKTRGTKYARSARNQLEAQDSVPLA